MIVFIYVPFYYNDGIALLLQTLKELEERQIFVKNYLNFTESRTL